MVPTLLAWMAGFFDGEGSISCHCTNRKSAYVRLVVSVCQRDARPIEIFQNAFPYGHTYTWKGPKGTPIADWSCGGDTALMFLQCVRPYLVVKAERADLAIEFLTKPWRSHGNAHGGKRILRTAEQKYIDVKLAHQITILNAKGNQNAKTRARTFLDGIQFDDAMPYRPPTDLTTGRFLPIKRDGTSSLDSLG